LKKARLEKLKKDRAAREFKKPVGTWLRALFPSSLDFRRIGRPLCLFQHLSLWRRHCFGTLISAICEGMLKLIANRQTRWNFGDSPSTPVSLEEFLNQREADGFEFFAGKEPWLKGIHKLSWQTFFSADPEEGLPAEFVETHHARLFFQRSIRRRQPRWPRI
jgi:hypothetical protein